MSSSFMTDFKGLVPDFIAMSLRSKIMATIILSISLVMGVEIILNHLYFDKKDALRFMEVLSIDLAASTYSGIKYPMSVGDSAAVEQVLTDVREKMEGIEVFICDSSQQVTWSTHRSKVSTKVSDSIADPKSLAILTSILESGTFLKESHEVEIDDQRFIIFCEPILNEKDCFHCHGSSRKVLGGMVVKTSVERALATVTIARNRRILAAVLALVSIIAISYVIIEKFIARRVKVLINGVQKVASGDLDHKIPVVAQDEICELANSFNTMTSELKDARDEITNRALNLEDLVEERTAQLKKAQENAIQSEKMASMGRLAAIVAHEVNNPLAGIRTYAKLMLKSSGECFVCDAKKYIRYLETIESESARCGDIVKGLLQFARPTKPRFRKHDINTLARQSLRLVQHQMDLLSIDARLNLAPGLIEAVCDDQKIKQALVALLLNACDAVQKETGIIEIRTLLFEKENKIEISVEDNGVGMDEETKSHMFEPFFTTKTVSPEHEASLNSGLGVSVVYEIVNSHQGTIFVESEQGKGTNITIALNQELQIDD